MGTMTAGNKELKVLVIGTGRMGQAVEHVCRSRGHAVVGMFGRADLAAGAWPEADVAIEFTRPDSAVAVIAACRERGIPLVSGTTGWESAWDAVEQATVAAKHPLVWSPNFSRGVYLFRKALRSVAAAMEGHTDFALSVHEVHHTGKLDAPSGTAKAIGQDLVSLGWSDVPITAARLAGVPGTHQVEWRGPIDSITLTHSALNRTGFALGAVLASEWLSARSEPVDRIFGMDDVWG